MKVYYEDNCGSFVVANNEEEVKIVLSDLYIIKKDEFKIRECDICNEGYYVGAVPYIRDYTFGEVVDKFKQFDENDNFSTIKIYKSNHGYKIWKSFYDILTELDLKMEEKTSEAFEIFNGED